jgi:trk system potassium uptake protein TrkH
MEVLAGRGTPGAGAPQITRIADPSQRVTRFAVQLFPAYAGFTLVLWCGLVLMGEAGFRALCLAMATVSTSGIMPGGNAGVSGSGIPGEILIALFLLPAGRPGPGRARPQPAA